MFLLPASQEITTYLGAHEDKLKELELFCLEKARQNGDMMAAFKYIKQGPMKNGQEVFSIATETKTKNNKL